MGLGAKGRAPHLRDWLERLAGRLELPQDVVLDLPKATLVGGLQVLIENHRGLLEYTPQRIRVRTARGEWVITGSRLQIGSIHRQELVIDGRITGIQLVDTSSEASLGAERGG